MKLGWLGLWQDRSPVVYTSRAAAILYQPCIAMQELGPLLPGVLFSFPVNSHQRILFLLIFRFLERVEAREG